MAYNGYLLSMGGTVFPTKYIYRESYEHVTHVQDLDSTVNNKGVLQRNVLDHLRYTVKFETPPMQKEDYDAMWAFIRSKYISRLRREVHLTFYDEETDDYISAKFYLAEFTHSYYHFDTTTGTGLYNSQTLEFISY